MLTASESQEDSPSLDQRKIALEQYRNVIGYLQYENTVFHVRNAFFMSVNLGLAAPVLATAAMDDPFNRSPAAFVAAGLVCAFGLFVSSMWYGSLKTVSDIWIERWIGILEKLEPTAFGSVEVFRNLPNGPRVHSNKTDLIWLARLFQVFWLFAIVGYAAIVGVSISSYLGFDISS